MARNPLWLSVTELRKRPGSRRDIEVVATLDGLALSASHVPDGAELVLTGVLESLSEGLTAVGSVVAPFVGECRRCLGEVHGQIDAPFREVFEPHPVEGETYKLDGDQVDLEQMVRDAVLLALPLAPLCTEDCAGPAPDIIPVVVADDPPLSTPDPRWAALDALKFDN